jgi:hypothetical protein
MKYVIEMVSGVMIYIPSFTKIGSGIRKLIGGFRKLLLKSVARTLMNTVPKHAIVYMHL